MVWPRRRRDIDDKPWERLRTAVKAMRPPWTVLPEVQLAVGADRLVLDYILVHPACGVVLIDAADSPTAERERNAALDLFRRFLDEGEFETFFPGYLPVVQLPCELHDGEGLPALIAEAFADAPLLTVKDRGWAGALVTVVEAAVVEAARTNRRERSATPPQTQVEAFAAPPQERNGAHTATAPPASIRAERPVIAPGVRDAAPAGTAAPRAAATPARPSADPRQRDPIPSLLHAEPEERVAPTRWRREHWMLVPLIAIGTIGLAALFWEPASRHPPTTVASAPVSAAPQDAAPAGAAPLAAPSAADAEPAPAQPPAASATIPVPAPPEASAPVAPAAIEPPPVAPTAIEPPPAALTASVPAPVPPEPKAAAVGPPSPATASHGAAHQETPHVATKTAQWPPLPARKPHFAARPVAHASRTADVRQPVRESPPASRQHPRPSDAKRAPPPQQRALTPRGEGPPIDVTDLPPLEP
jgi:hypothetical protein